MTFFLSFSSEYPHIYREEEKMAAYNHNDDDVGKVQTIVLFIAHGDHNSTEIAKEILKGMDPDNSPAFNYLLAFAAAFGNTSLVTFLVNEMRADPNCSCCDNPDMLMFHQNIGKGNVEMVRVLHRLGSDPNIPDSSGWTGLDIAKQNKSRKCLSYLKNNSKKLGVDFQIRYNIKPAKTKS